MSVSSSKISNANAQFHSFKLDWNSCVTANYRSNEFVEYISWFRRCQGEILNIQVYILQGIVTSSIFTICFAFYTIPHSWLKCCVMWHVKSCWFQATALSNLDWVLKKYCYNAPDKILIDTCWLRVFCLVSLGLLPVSWSRTQHCWIPVKLATYLWEITLKFCKGMKSL